MGIFGNMMNNYFYGKSGKGDYRIEDMPANRVQLFTSVWKVRWSAMFGVNILHIIPCLPAAIWTIMNISMLLTMDADMLIGGGAGYMTIYLAVLFPLIAITGPFQAGTAFVLRNWARDEHSFVWSDFWDAVKGNWKQALPVAAISGLMPLLLHICWQFYGSLAADNFLYMIPLGLVMLVVIMWTLSVQVMYTMMVTYSLSLKNLIRNAVLITMARLPLSIGIKLLTLVVPAIIFAVLMLFPGIELYVFLVTCLLYATYVPVLNRFIVASYSNAVCEKFLNPKIEGARTNIGLRPENWDDTEYLPEDDED